MCPGRFRIRCFFLGFAFGLSWGWSLKKNSGSGIRFIGRINARVIERSLRCRLWQIRIFGAR